MNSFDHPEYELHMIRNTVDRIYSYRAGLLEAGGAKMAVVSECPECRGETIYGHCGPCLFGRVCELKTEVERLKRGDFTAEEFQALCHHLDERRPGCTEEEFKQGCVEYRQKLFGTPQPGADASYTGGE